MTDDARQALQTIIDYCSRKCWEISRAESSASSAPEIQTGQKLAYKDVLRQASTLIDGTP